MTNQENKNSISFKAFYENKEKRYMAGVIEESLRYAMAIVIPGEEVDRVHAAGDLFQVFFGITEKEFNWHAESPEKLDELADRLKENAPADRLILYRVGKTKNSLPGNNGEFKPKCETMDDPSSPDAYVNAVTTIPSMDKLISPDALRVNDLASAYFRTEEPDVEVLRGAQSINDLCCLVHVANTMARDKQRSIKNFPEKLRELFCELDDRLRHADTLWAAKNEDGSFYVDSRSLPWVFSDPALAEKAQSDMKAKNIDFSIVSLPADEMFRALDDAGMTSFLCDICRGGVSILTEGMLMDGRHADDVAEMDMDRAIRVYNAARKIAGSLGASEEDKTRMKAIVEAFYKKFMALPERIMMYNKNTTDRLPTIDPTGCAWFFTTEERAKLAIEKNEGMDFEYKTLSSEEFAELCAKEFYRMGIVKLRLNPGAGDNMAEIMRDDLQLMDTEGVRAMENHDALPPEISIRMWGFHNSMLQLELLRHMQAVNSRSQNENVMAHALTHMDALYKEIAHTLFLVPITFEGEENQKPEAYQLHISKASAELLQEKKKNLVIYTGGAPLKSAAPVRKALRYYTLQNKNDNTVWIPAFTDLVEFRRMYDGTQYQVGVMTYDELVAEAKKHTGIMINGGGLRLPLMEKQMEEIEKRRNTPHVIYSTDPALKEKAEKEAAAKEAAAKAAEEKKAAEKKALEDQLEAKKQEFAQYKRSILGDKAAKKKEIMKEILALEEKLKKFEK